MGKVRHQQCQMSSLEMTVVLIQQKGSHTRSKHSSVPIRGLIFVQWLQLTKYIISSSLLMDVRAWHLLLTVAWEQPKTIVEPHSHSHLKLRRTFQYLWYSFLRDLEVINPIFAAKLRLFHCVTLTLLQDSLLMYFCALHSSFSDALLLVESFTYMQNECKKSNQNFGLSH